MQEKVQKEIWHILALDEHLSFILNGPKFKSYIKQICMHFPFISFFFIFSSFYINSLKYISCQKEDYMKNIAENGNFNYTQAVSMSD